MTCQVHLPALWSADHLTLSTWWSVLDDLQAAAWSDYVLRDIQEAIWTRPKAPETPLSEYRRQRVHAIGVQWERNEGTPSLSPTSVLRLVPRLHVPSSYGLDGALMSNVQVGTQHLPLAPVTYALADRVQASHAWHTVTAHQPCDALARAVASWPDPGPVTMGSLVVLSPPGQHPDLRHLASQIYPWRQTLLALMFNNLLHRMPAHAHMYVDHGLDDGLHMTLTPWEKNQEVWKCNGLSIGPFSTQPDLRRVQGEMALWCERWRECARAEVVLPLFRALFREDPCAWPRRGAWSSKDAEGAWLSRALPDLVRMPYEHWLLNQDAALAAKPAASRARL